MSMQIAGFSPAYHNRETDFYPQLPNPAHTQFFPRGSTGPREETRAVCYPCPLGLLDGESVIDHRESRDPGTFLGSKIRLKVADSYHR